MSKDSLFKKQNTSRPKIEDAITEALTGKEFKNAQDFFAFIKENKMTPSWASVNSWKVNYCNFAKKLVILRREAIFTDRVPKCRYIKAADRT